MGYSSMNRGAWWATVHRVAKSRTDTCTSHTRKLSSFKPSPSAVSCRSPGWLTSFADPGCVGSVLVKHVDAPVISWRAAGEADLSWLQLGWQG